VSEKHNQEMNSMISISSTGLIDGSKHFKFKAFTPKTGEEFCDTICTKAWSPIIWEDGFRKKQNFLTSEYLSLDFDDGRWTLDAALTWVMEHGYKAIIATTKSHQLEKISSKGVVTPATDRFRVVIPFSREIDDIETFEYNMKEVMKICPVDISCKDGGRFYFPCKEIVHFLDGGNYPVIEYTDAMKKENSDGLLNHKKKLLEHKKNSTISRWVFSVLYGNTKTGDRHKTAYRMGAELKACGWTLEAIYAVCNSTNLKDIGVDELQRAVTNGFNTAEEIILEIQMEEGCAV